MEPSLQKFRTRQKVSDEDSQVIIIIEILWVQGPVLSIWEAVVKKARVLTFQDGEMQ